jgi:hypothetical protein
LEKRQLSLNLYQKPVTHIVCYSGGISSALVAIEVVRKFGKERVVLCNHDISSRTEDADIKRFKEEVATYLQLPITYVNINGIKGSDRIPDQFDLAVAEGGFKFGVTSYTCSRRLKTEPFHHWLRGNYSQGECVLYYGFSCSESERIDRRASILAEIGYEVAFPLVDWEQTIHDTREIGIEPPRTYETMRHANCMGCFRAGRQHFYVTYVKRPDIWEKAKWAEEKLYPYTIIKGVRLAKIERLFQAMKEAGIPATEHIPSQTFWAKVRHALGDTYQQLKSLQNI